MSQNKILSIIVLSFLAVSLLGAAGVFAGSAAPSAAPTGFAVGATLPTYYTLTVSKTGTGTVVSNPTSINCGTTCSGSFLFGVAVTLTAAPTSGSTFAGWSGACTGTGTCTVSMTSAKTVTATFTSTDYLLTVTKSGTGSGLVFSSLPGISCGPDCSELYAPGTSLLLTATPASGSTFAGWGGACTGTVHCAVTMTQARSVTATFTSTVTTYALTTNVNTAAGRVTSSPAGIDCRTTSPCIADFASGTTVTLTFTLTNSKWSFQGWSGDCTGTANTCIVVMNGTKFVSTITGSAGKETTPPKILVAHSPTNPAVGQDVVIRADVDDNSGFASEVDVFIDSIKYTCSVAAGTLKGTTPTNCAITTNAHSTTGTHTYYASAKDNASNIGRDPLSGTKSFIVGAAPTNATKLVVVKLGPGSGTVTSSPTGINCGTQCSAPFAKGTVVTLSRTPAKGSMFIKWGGDDCVSGNTQCIVTMNTSKTSTATFSTTSYFEVNLAKAGSGSGTVSSKPAGINCGSVCNGFYKHNTTVYLTATPASGSVFSYWALSCSGTQTTCIVRGNTSQYDRFRSVDAVFTKSSVTKYSLTINKSGSGTVTSSPAGINCGPDCSENYGSGLNVTLTATPAGNSTFSSWAVCDQSGGCPSPAPCIDGTVPCTVTMDAGTRVYATFK